MSDTVYVLTVEYGTYDGVEYDTLLFRKLSDCATAEKNIKAFFAINQSLRDEGVIDPELWTDHSCCVTENMGLIYLHDTPTKKYLNDEFMPFVEKYGLIGRMDLEGATMTKKELR